jgi:hypothetical protein
MGGFAEVSYRHHRNLASVTVDSSSFFTTITSLSVIMMFALLDLFKHNVMKPFAVISSSNNFSFRVLRIHHSQYLPFTAYESCFCFHQLANHHRHKSMAVSLS